MPAVTNNFVLLLIMSNPLPTFSDPEGDLIIRSLDGVDFSVRKSKLETMSPVFSELFAKSSKDKRPIIIELESPTLDYIVRLSHFRPDAQHHPKTLDDLVALFDAAESYGIEPVFETLECRLRNAEFLAATPLRIYAIACRFEWEETARVAARATLRHAWDDLPDCDELGKMTGRDLRRLERYHRLCGKAAADLTISRNLTWIEGDWSWFGSKCRVRKLKEVEYAVGKKRMVWFAAQWWIQYMVAAGMALAQRPCSESIEEACAKVALCECCGTATELGRFADMFCLAVDGAVSEVRQLLDC